MQKKYAKNGTILIKNKRTGCTVLEKNYKQGILHGRLRYYWDNGVLRVKGAYADQRRIGKWKNFDIHGNIILEELF